MREGWESEAQNWARLARTPGLDHAHEDINLPAFLDLMPGPGRRTLDLACGEGRLGRVLASLGHRVAGIDASPTLVRLAVTHQQRETAALADAARLPFPDQAFDLVVAYMCLHDIDAMPQAVTETARVLERSGRLCVAIPHPINTAGDFPARDAAAPFVISGSYLDPAPANWVFHRGGVRMTFHSAHRPLESYVRALEAGGLLIEAIREVRPPPRAVAPDPAARRWQRIPLFLHLRAVKPG
jgi:SAM-dependent methyltransferase